MLGDGVVDKRVDAVREGRALAAVIDEDKIGPRVADPYREVEWVGRAGTCCPGAPEAFANVVVVVVVLFWLLGVVLANCLYDYS